MSAQSIKTTPQFMGDDSSGRFFTVTFSCMEKPKARIVFIPPFGEEMNRCRSLVAQQARSFATQGYACTLLDFLGTGDSQGELCDATLANWRENIRFTLEKIALEEDVPLILWGLRMGALIALDYAAKFRPAVRDIILWQPVTNGKMFVTQVLRQRVASLMVRELPAETTKEIRQKLEEGEKVEVAGYTLGGPLMGDFERIDLAQLTDLCSGSIHWLEHVIEPGKEPGIPAQKAIVQLREQGNTVVLKTFSDPQIWQIHERDFAPQLLALSDGLLP
ncbi:MAG: exosortase A-associated hydrolase 2 [Halioglobus sp.]|jgi:exosortase A-associated hydrolase 2